MTVTLFLVFLCLALYNVGCMTTLQLQHYGIYPAVGEEHFAAYIAANNRAAALPTIVPALLLLFSSVLVMVQRPGFMTSFEAAAGLGLNLVALLSTFVWQRPLHSQLAQRGYDEATVRRLIATNWIRTVAHWLIGLLAIGVLVRLVVP